MKVIILPGVKMVRLSELEKEIYAVISCSTGGISPGNLSGLLKVDLFDVKKALSGSPLFSDLCYRNSRGNYCPMISGSSPHFGLEHYSWFYSSAEQFLKTGEADFMEKTEDSCINTATIIGTPRFPQKMAKMIRCSVAGMFKDLELLSGKPLPPERYRNWETAFHVNIATTHGEIRMSSDVLLLTDFAAYPIIFVNAEKPSERIISRIVERTEAFPVIMGENCEVVPVAVMIGSSESFQTVTVHSGAPEDSMKIPVCSRDMLYRILPDFRKDMEE